MLTQSDLLEKGLKREFNRSFEAMINSPEYALIGQVASEIPSDSNLEKYAWLGGFPAVREWKGDKHGGIIPQWDYTITNKDYEVTVAIDRNEVEDDKLDAILPRVAAMPIAIRNHMWGLLETLLVNGTTDKAYNAVAFFSNSQTGGDNLAAGTGTSVAQILADVITNVGAMYNFKDDEGNYLRLQGDSIICPTQIYGSVLQAVKAAAAEATYNPAAGWIKRVIPSPVIGASDANDWYLLCTSFPVKPLILQTRKAPVAVLDDTQVKLNRTYYYSAEGRYNAGYGFPQMAIKVVNT